MFTLADAIAAGARIDALHVIRDLSAILLRAEHSGYALRRLTADRVICIGDARGVILAIDSWHDARPTANAPADLAASVHALGLIAFQTLTGVMPYAASTLAPFARHVADVTRVPAKVAWLVDRMLARDPNDRPTLAEVYTAAQRMLAAPVAAAKPHPRVVQRATAYAIDQTEEVTRIDIAI
ncbi:MAG: hypothetical protein JO257_14080 [Deltaproteobacteria bacterium]|nr:hypothetical protein [Deltaproteobacteria bacterium]